MGYACLARLLEYPGEDYFEAVGRCLAALRPLDSEAAGAIAAFEGAIRGLRTEELQERFIQTFDLNPVCALEVGWQIFGDDYKRGEFLVKMREELRAHHLRESAELPDHLTHVLPVLAQMEPEEADPFAFLFVLPAVEKMLAGLRGKENPFEHILTGIRCMLSRHPAPVSPEVSHA